MNPGNFTLTLFRGRARKWRARLWQDREKTQLVPLDGCTPVAGISLAGGERIELACSVVEDEENAPDGRLVEITISAEQAALLTGTYYSWTLGVEDSAGDWNPCLKGPVQVTTDDSLEP
jgi:hypothetical protein